MDASEVVVYPKPSRCRRDTYVVVFMLEFILITVSLCLMTKDCNRDVPGGDSSAEGEKNQCASSHETYFLVALAYILSVKYIAYYFSFVVVDSYPLRAVNADKRRMAELWKQYIAALLFSTFLCTAAAILYMIPRWGTYIVYAGGFMNSAVAIDCIAQARSAHYKVHHTIFPELEEVKPVGYHAFASSLESLSWHHRECMICLSDFEPHDSVVKLPCQHVFHTDCVSHWLHQNRGCPVKCRLAPYTLALPPPLLPGDDGPEAYAPPFAPRNHAWNEDVLPMVVGAPAPDEDDLHNLEVVHIVN